MGLVSGAYCRGGEVGACRRGLGWWAVWARGLARGRERSAGAPPVRACGVPLCPRPHALSSPLSTPQGLNGTGKSNILDAIVFVLGISNLSQVSGERESSRRALLTPPRDASVRPAGRAAPALTRHGRHRHAVHSS